MSEPKRLKKQHDKWETVHWIDGYGDCAEGGGVVEPIWNHRTLSKNHVARFRHSLYTLMELSGCARNLIDYLSEIMDSDNVIHNSTTVREQFISFVERATGGNVQYKANTVAKAMDELSKMGLLMRHKKGSYYVNPIFFMRGGRERDRVRLVRMVLEFNSKKTKMEIIRKQTTQ